MFLCLLGVVFPPHHQQQQQRQTNLLVRGIPARSNINIYRFINALKEKKRSNAFQRPTRQRGIFQH